MTIERHFYCDAPDCNVHWVEAAPHVLTVIDSGNINSAPTEQHFCGYNCLLKYAAEFPPDEIIPLRPEGE